MGGSQSREQPRQGGLSLGGILRGGLMIGVVLAAVSAVLWIYNIFSRGGITAVAGDILKGIGSAAGSVAGLVSKGGASIGSFVDQRITYKGSLADKAAGGISRGAQSLLGIFSK